MISREIKKIIRDPIHDYISIYEDEVPLLDCILVQRLRNIKQNGMAYFTYPALTVSRFEHSLGTMHLADQMLSSALAKSQASTVEEFLSLCAKQCSWAAEEVTPKLHRVIRVAGLLHDLGQLPFSHTLEEIIHDCLENVLLPKEMERWQQYKVTTEGSLHEFLTLLLIESDPQISNILGKDGEVVIRILYCKLHRTIHQYLGHCMI